MKLIHPISEEKRRELEEELEREKARLLEASGKAAQAIKRDLSIRRWIENYPLETAIVIIATGIALGRVLVKSREITR